MITKTIAKTIWEKVKGSRKKQLSVATWSFGNFCVPVMEGRDLTVQEIKKAKEAISMLASIATPMEGEGVEVRILFCLFISKLFN